MSYTQIQIDALFERLPEKLKAAILSVENYEILKSIRAEYKLSDIQAGELGSETGRVVMGLTRTEEFVPHLIERLNVHKVLAEAIGKEISEKILKPLQTEIDALSKSESVPGGVIKVPPPKPIPQPLDAANSRIRSWLK